MDESKKIMKRRHERIVRVRYVPIRTHCPGTGYLACTGLMKTEVMVVQSRRDMKGSDVIAHFAYLAEKQFSYLAVTV